ncbi:MAG TPA: hypothetical protein PKK15_22275, partial [Kouleothrix sp.]|nr:hypothetical protein [Kouleothrix sp.]
MLHKALYILTALCALGCTACGLRETQPQPAAPLPTAQIALAAQTPPLSRRPLPLRTARLCRDKVAMKQFLRDNQIPCAQSAPVTT